MEENKKTEVNTEVKNTEVKTEGRRNDNRNRKFDKKKPRNNNRTSKPKSDLEDKVIEIKRLKKVFKDDNKFKFNNNLVLENKKEIIVIKVVKGGRQFRFAATVVVGNRKGLVGLGTGKAKEMPDAVKKATQAASKNLIKVDLIDNRTISHDIIVKEGAVRVMLKPAKEGTGVKAGGPVRDVLELAGVKDVLSKSLGSSTKINAARATLNALKAQKSPDHVAYLRDKKVEELR